MSAASEMSKEALPVVHESIEGLSVGGVSEGQRARFEASTKELQDQGMAALDARLGAALVGADAQLIEMTAKRSELQEQGVQRAEAKKAQHEAQQPSEPATPVVSVDMRPAQFAQTLSPKQVSETFEATETSDEPVNVDLDAMPIEEVGTPPTGRGTPELQHIDAEGLGPRDLPANLPDLRDKYGNIKETGAPPAPPTPVRVQPQYVDPQDSAEKRLRALHEKHIDLTGEETETFSDVMSTKQRRARKLYNEHQALLEQMKRKKPSVR